jgi:tetratricopeptide (TPR) repeat protein
MELKMNGMNEQISNGYTLWSIGEYTEALNLFQSLQSYEKDNAKISSGLGFCKWSLGLFADALKCFQTAINLEPLHAAHWSNAGLCSRDLKLYEQAINLFKTSVAIDPLYAAAYNEWANVCYDTNMLDEALSLYDKSLAIDISREVVFHNKGVCLKKAGQYYEAKKYFLKALSYNNRYHHSLRELQTF